MADEQDRVHKDESIFNRILHWLPGFAGYRDREVRRRADQVLRDHLVGLLDAEKAKLQRFEAELSRAGKIQAVGALDLVLGHLTHARDRLRFADYGYTGFFDTPSVRPGDLDKLYAHDQSMRDAIAAIGQKTDAVAAAAEGALDAALGDLDKAIEGLSAMVDQRGDVIQAAASG
jgi:hypothetical protein